MLPRKDEACFMNHICTTFLCVLYASASLLRGADTPATACPNIVFIFSDDHSCQSIGAYRT